MASRQKRFENKFKNSKVVAIPSKKKSASSDSDEKQLYNLYMMY